MKKAYPSSSKSVQKVSFRFGSLLGLICHYSLNGWKNLLFALIALLLIPSCKDKKTDLVENKVTSITLAPPSPQAVVGGKPLLEITVLLAEAANREIIKDVTLGEAFLIGMGKTMGAFIAISFVLFILKLCAKLCVQCVKTIYKSIRRKP